jgi:Transglutaminase-like superfamily
MTELQDYATQSGYSDPGRYASLLDGLPTDIAELTAVVRNVLIHYRGGMDFTADRLAEVDNRWIERLLETDHQRNGTRLTAPREPTDRVVGCCRDFALLTIAALRHQGVPARSRVGFAPYFAPGFHHDHVILEYWDGARWVAVDAELDPAGDWEFDPIDMDPSAFRSAARVWTGFRAGDLDADDFGVDPQLPIRGGWFVRNYVFQELAHRQRDELLLWDTWGAMATDLDADLPLTDEIAALLMAADAGDAGAEQELADRYCADPVLHPDGRVLSFSPTRESPISIDLARRAAVPPAG